MSSRKFYQLINQKENKIVKSLIFPLNVYAVQKQKKNLVKARQEVYNKAKEEGLSDMQALVKTFEISPRED